MIQVFIANILCVVILGLNQQITKLKPRIKNLKEIYINGNIYGATTKDSVQINYGSKWIKTHVNAQGNFIIEIDELVTEIPATLEYKGQRTSMYLTPGDRLELSVDFTRFDETINYRGKGSDANNYLARSLWNFDYNPKSKTQKIQKQLNSKTTPREMRLQADSIRNYKKDFLADYSSNHKLSKAFLQDAKLRIDLTWATSLLEYPVYYNSVNKKEVILSNNYFDFINQLPLKQLDGYARGDRGIDENTIVQRFLRSYSTRLLSKGILNTNSSEIEKIYKQATIDFGHTYCRDFAVYIFLIWQLESSPAGVLAAYSGFKMQNKDSTFRRDLKQMMDTKLRLQPNQTAPNFTLLSSNGKEISLSDYKGKIVYLDFWGTWCIPCMEEMPFSEKMRKKFQDKGVVFIYISVRDSKEKWLQTVSSEGFASYSSVHLYSSDWNIATLYGIMSYPSYLLIGRDGKIIKSNAPKPSETEEINKAIEEAINE